MRVADDVEEMRWSEAMGVAHCGGRECTGGSSGLNLAGISGRRSYSNTTMSQSIVGVGPKL